MIIERMMNVIIRNRLNIVAAIKNITVLAFLFIFLSPYFVQEERNQKDYSTHHHRSIGMDAGSEVPSVLSGAVEHEATVGKAGHNPEVPDHDGHPQKVGGLKSRNCIHELIAAHERSVGRA